MAFHAIDPDGDTILILRNPNAPFAVWDESAEPPDALAQAKPPTSTTDTKQATAEPGSPAKSPTPEEVRMRLSSKHLALASEYFARMLKGPWQEASADADEKAEYVVHAEDWDEEALLTLMNIIHGRTRVVPREVDVRFVAKIAVLVDYYKCHEVVDIWYKSVWRNRVDFMCSTKHYGVDLICILFICTVFLDGSASFQALSRTAAREARGPLQTLNLPIPERLVGTSFRGLVLSVCSANQYFTDKIESVRQKLVRTTLDELYKTYDLLCKNDHPTITGRLACSELGGLTMKLSLGDLLYPRPSGALLGYSFVGLSNLLKLVQSTPHPSTENIFAGAQQPAPSPSTNTTGGLFSNIQQTRPSPSTTTTWGQPPPPRPAPSFGFGSTQGPVPSPSTNSTGGLFGSSSTQQPRASSPANTTGGLFSNLQQTRPSPSTTTTWGQPPRPAPSFGFGSTQGPVPSPSTNSTGGLFGNGNTQQPRASSPANTTGGLFGGQQQTPNPPSNVFGTQQPRPSPSTSTTGGLFPTSPLGPSWGLPSRDAPQTSGTKPSTSLDIGATAIASTLKTIDALENYLRTVVFLSVFSEPQE
ncbi:hypothetical protein G7046_g5963 [Stylonectria norvegica]|nr:hypothetical protein G7046_g5963 [Stylonectria norvegica]